MKSKSFSLPFLDDLTMNFGYLLWFRWSTLMTAADVLDTYHDAFNTLECVEKADFNQKNNTYLSLYQSARFNTKYRQNAKNEKHRN